MGAREDLLDAARRLLGSRPPVAISGRDVTNEAGVTYGLLGHYFHTKDELFFEAVTGLERKLLPEGTEPGEIAGLLAAAVTPAVAAVGARVLLDAEWWDRLADRSRVSPLSGLVDHLVASGVAPAAATEATVEGLVLLVASGLVAAMSQFLRDGGVPVSEQSEHHVVAHLNAAGVNRLTPPT